MNRSELLIKQALETYERISRRLESALDLQRKMPSRASRTTAFAAFQTRINQLKKIQTAAHARYVRRKNNEAKLEEKIANSY